ncbi:hypothetical protein [Halalkalibacter okhensis]|uniref:DUF4367 domain-containing protein n=1 Tax=Halalkalibacter okhensis TaxID=333138 RepID=A0A0B0IBD7_9BACI|nr:hypothetical protein [Halalkalibacter okhensis]KHF38182.1 hypothetical protein LQ50_22780 [Halalkalibacter okhensis]
MNMSIAKIILLVIVISLVSPFNGIYVQAKSQDDKQIDEFIDGNDYISAKKAIKLFEQKQGKEVSLPKKLPFRPTHKFGQMTIEGDLRLHYLRVFNKPHQDFIITILSPESKIEKHTTAEDKVVTLKDGTKAYFQNDDHVHTLIFKKKSLGYLLTGSTRQSKDYSLEGLMEIAESI